MIQTERLVQNFCKLVSFDSPSYGERSICDYLTAALQQLGLTVTEDAAAETIGGNAGNLYAVLPATEGLEGLPPLLFSLCDYIITYFIEYVKVFFKKSCTIYARFFCAICI